MDLLNDEPRILFRKFLVPAVSSAVAVAIYSFVDTIVIGQSVGADGTAACAVVLPIFTIAGFVALLCGVGGSVFMSKARGEGRQEKGDAYYTAALLYVGIITMLMWVLGVMFQIPLYRLLGADDALLPYALDYGKWIFGAFPSFVFVTFLGCFIRTDGSPRFVMAVTFIGGVINMIGDIVLVFPLGMGMEGAAIATASGSVIQSILLIGYILLGKTTLKIAKPFKWFSAVRKISVVGFGAGISQIAMTVVTFIINNQIMKYSGSAALAVYGLLCTIAALFLSIFSGIGQAAQPIVSANFGAGQLDRYRMIAKIGMRTAVIFGIISFAVCALFPSQIIWLFMKETPEVVEIAPFIIRVYAISFLPMSINMFSTAYLQSVTKAVSSTVISLLRGLILTSILLYVMPLFLGSSGIWWAVTIAESLTAAVAVICMIPWFKKDKEQMLFIQK